MLTAAELEFLKSQGLSAADVYDARHKTAAAWKAGVRAAGLHVVLGSPCRNGGHRLRTRSGHCIQCDTSKLAYQQRFNSNGFVYIAGSRSARLLKIGTTVDPNHRGQMLNNHRYGGIRDWKLLFYAELPNSGKVEHIALSKLRAFKHVQTYDKDGTDQEAQELLRTTFPEALKAVSDAIGGTRPNKLWMARNHKDYDFSSKGKR